MGSNINRSQRILFLVIFSFLFLSACSTPSWLSLKKAPPHRAKAKELVDKEIILIDRQEYVKVINPLASGGENQPKYLYLPVEEYLAKRDQYMVPTTRGSQEKRPSPHAPPIDPPVRIGTEMASAPNPLPSSIQLKKKVLVLHFDDRTSSGEESLGDWLAENLIKEMSLRSPQLLFVDFYRIKEFLEKNGGDLREIVSPKTLKILNEVFGIHAIVLGELTGPYIFTTKGPRDQEASSTALIKIEMKVVDTLSGKIFKTLSSQNPVFSTKEIGIFSDEKAKKRAFDLALTELSRSLSRELDRIDWFCRVAKVEGDEIYINAGKLTGLKVGDVMEVYRPTRTGERGDIRGEIRISTIFGMDASIGKLIQGEKPEAEDILRLVRREGS